MGPVLSAETMAGFVQYTLTDHGIAETATLEGVKSCTVRLCFSLQSPQFCQIAMNVQGFYLRNF